MRSKQAAVAFIFITILLDMTAMGLAIPVAPKLIEQLSGAGAAGTALLVGAFAFVFAFVQFLVSPLHGALSDRFGRRPVLLASNAGLGVDYIALAMAPNLAWLFVGRIVCAMMAGSIAAGYAYVADITEPKDRVKGFGMLGAAAGVGIILGPVMGGLLANIDLRLPFYLAAGLSLLNAMYGFFVLPESLPRERRSKELHFWRNNPVSSLRRFSADYPKMRLMLVAIFLFYIAVTGVTQLLILYTAHRYGWSPAHNGLLLMSLGVGDLIAQGLLVNMSVKRWGDRNTAVGGTLVRLMGLLILGSATTSGLFWVGIVFICLGGVGPPALLGLASTYVASTENGRFQGVVRCLNGLAAIVGPPLILSVFAASTGHGSLLWVGAPFFLAAAISVGGLQLFLQSTARPKAANLPAEAG